MGVLGAWLLALAVIAAVDAGAAAFLAIGGVAGLAGALLGDSHSRLRWLAMAIAATVALSTTALVIAGVSGTD